MASSALNYSLLSIPVYYVFSIVPHMYAGAILSSEGYKVNNANPKASLSPSAVQGKVSEETFQKYQRAENAMSNNQEQMPIFIAAILASIIAERTTAAGGLNRIADVDATGISTFIASWFAIRTVYNVAYISISDYSLSFIRSGAWASGFGLAAYQIYKAAQVLGA